MTVNLIGGKTEGLPIERPSVICIDIENRTDVEIWMKYDEKIGEFYWENSTANPTPARELREQAYETMLYAENGNPLILWDSEPITIDAANDLWAKYAAENHPDANILQELIKAAKEYIRGLYPDEVD